MNTEPGTLVEVEPKMPTAVDAGLELVPYGLGATLGVIVLAVVSRVRRRRRARVDAKAKEIHDRLPR